MKLDHQTLVHSIQHDTDSYLPHFYKKLSIWKLWQN